MRITGKEILSWGCPEGKAVGAALNVINKFYPEASEIEVRNKLSAVFENPNQFETDKRYDELIEALNQPVDQVLPLKDTPDVYKVYGADGIEDGALNQIDIAMRLPIAKAGALMADAHQGYGLPIGGVLATENAVIPYGVGVDIGCRMCMSLYEIPASILDKKGEDLKKMLERNTRFGRAVFNRPQSHEVLENPIFDELPLLSSLKDKAARQIGTSGGGNHFVEFGVTEIKDPENEFGLAPGKYLALLSHSGSRGLGATIANHYTKKAMELTSLPHEARHLAWLDLDTEIGQEYWLAMNLAGDYASACHHQIHERMAVGLRTTPLAMVENHHNFAWNEKDEEGNNIIVHRKGATPAGKGVLGIIPGSMTAPGFIVRGKGAPESLNSASHGAGRTMSRSRAKRELDASEVSAYVQNAGVEVIGSGLDEAPMAYKDIWKVMDAQKDLVDIIGVFKPKIVRMCGDKKFREVD